MKDWALCIPKSLNVHVESYDPAYNVHVFECSGLCDGHCLVHLTVPKMCALVTRLFEYPNTNSVTTTIATYIWGMIHFFNDFISAHQYFLSLSKFLSLTHFSLSQSLSLHPCPSLCPYLSTWHLTRQHTHTHTHTQVTMPRRRCGCVSFWLCRCGRSSVWWWVPTPGYVWWWWVPTLGYVWWCSERIVMTFSICKDDMYASIRTGVFLYMSMCICILLSVYEWCMHIRITVTIHTTA